MFIDVLLKVSAGQQVTADANSTNTIDLGAPSVLRQVGSGDAIGFGVAITAVGTNSTAVKIEAIQSAAANLGTPDIIGEVDLAAADIGAGKLYFVPIPPGKPTKRYLGLYYDVGVTNDFTVDAWLTSRDLFSVQALAYAKGYSI
jgi:hypothetical protein